MCGMPLCPSAEETWVRDLDDPEQNTLTVTRLKYRRLEGDAARRRGGRPHAAHHLSECLQKLSGPVGDLITCLCRESSAPPSAPAGTLRWIRLRQMVARVAAAPEVNPGDLIEEIRVKADCFDIHAIENTSDGMDDDDEERLAMNIIKTRTIINHGSVEGRMVIKSRNVQQIVWGGDAHASGGGVQASTMQSGDIWFPVSVRLSPRAPSSSSRCAVAT